MFCPANDAAPEILFDLEPQRGRPPGWFWAHSDNRYTRASDGLVRLVSTVTQDCCSEAEQVRRLIDHAAEVFEYAHPERHFNAGLDAMPALYETTKGSCVGINSHLLAAARSLNLSVQYLAGYWFHPAKTETHNMHCWLAFRIDGELVFWDLAHQLKWGLPERGSGLSPAGGRRVVMNYDRGSCFDTPFGPIEVCHFVEPLWVLPNGEVCKPPMCVRIDETA